MNMNTTTTIAVVTPNLFLSLIRSQNLRREEFRLTMLHKKTQHSVIYDSSFSKLGVNQPKKCNSHSNRKAFNPPGICSPMHGIDFSQMTPQRSSCTHLDSSNRVNISCNLQKGKRIEKINYSSYFRTKCLLP